MKKTLLSLFAVVMTGMATTFTAAAVSPDAPVTFSQLSLNVGDTEYPMAKTGDTFKAEVAELTVNQEFCLKMKTVSFPAPEEGEEIPDESEVDFSNATVSYLAPQGKETEIVADQKEVYQMVSQDAPYMMHISKDALNLTFSLDYVSEFGMYLFSVQGENAQNDPSTFQAEWQIIIDGADADLSPTGEKTAEGETIYSITINEFSKDSKFMFRKDGVDYVSGAAEVELNPEYPAFLTSNDGSLPEMQLKVNAVNVTFFLYDDPVFGSQTFKVTGTEHQGGFEPIPSGSWSLKAGDQEYPFVSEGKSGTEETFSLSLDSFSKDTKFVVMHEGKAYTSYGVVEVNGEYGAYLMWDDQGTPMTLNGDYTDVKFTLVDDSVFGETTLKVSGTAGGGDTPSVDPEAWVVTVGDTAYEMKHTMGFYYSITVDEVAAGTTFTVQHGGKYWATVDAFTTNTEAGLKIAAQDEAGVMTIGQALNSVKFQVYADADYNDYTIRVTGDVPSGVAEIDSEDGEAVYFTLEGVKVDAPVKGLYIVVKDGKASKVVVK